MLSTSIAMAASHSRSVLSNNVGPDGAGGKITNRELLIYSVTSPFSTISFRDLDSWPRKKVAARSM